MNGRAFGVFCLSMVCAFACAAENTGLASGPAAGATQAGHAAATSSATGPEGPETHGEPYLWQPATRSPQPSTAETEPLAAACPKHDAALDRAAHFIATRELAGSASTDAEDVTYVMRAEGAPYVWPHLWVLSGGHVGDDAGRRFASWLEALPHVNETRCGTAHASNRSHEVAVGIAVDVLADLEPLPTEARIGGWLELKTRLLVPASAAQVLVLGPHGEPHSVPSSFDDGELRARFHADREGLFLAQVLATVAGGPRPVAEALVLAGSTPETLVLSLPAPGESAGTNAAPADALALMVNGARASEGLEPLTRDPRLDEVAKAHAEAMRDEHHLAHEGRDGSPADRVAGAGIDARSIGENVAHAADAAHAHRTLWQSPSHRSNLLEQRFDTFGIGVARDADDTLWVCELFAAMKQR
jgi:uncharacterized protein YkwD